MVRQPSVIIVDDSEVIRATAKQALESAGYKVTAVDTPLGLSNLVRNKQPDVVLIDVNMPALSGDKIVTLMRSHLELGETKLVLYSDIDRDRLAALARTVGADGYISKTNNVSLLLASISSYVGR